MLLSRLHSVLITSTNRSRNWLSQSLWNTIYINRCFNPPDNVSVLESKVSQQMNRTLAFTIRSSRKKSIIISLFYFYFLNCIFTLVFRVHIIFKHEHIFLECILLGILLLHSMTFKDLCDQIFQQTPELCCSNLHLTRYRSNFKPSFIQKPSRFLVISHVSLNSMR